MNDLELLKWGINGGAVQGIGNSYFLTCTLKFSKFYEVLSSKIYKFYGRKANLKDRIKVLGGICLIVRKIKKNNWFWYKSSNPN